MSVYNAPVCVVLAIGTQSVICGSETEKVTETLDCGNSIFLPAAGSRGYTSITETGSYGYWSSSLSTGSPYYAYVIYFSNTIDDYPDDRYNGFSVRPVTD